METRFRFLRVLNVIVFDGRPCRITEMCSTRTHVHIIGRDVFTGERYEMVKKYDELCTWVDVRSERVQLVDIEGGLYTAIDYKGDVREKIAPPLDVALAAEINAQFEKGDNIELNMCSALGEEHVMGYYVMKVE